MMCDSVPSNLQFCCFMFIFSERGAARKRQQNRGISYVIYIFTYVFILPILAINRLNYLVFIALFTAEPKVH
jgi:hypothetical protein